VYNPGGALQEEVELWHQIEYYIITYPSVAHFINQSFSTREGKILFPQFSFLL